MPARIAPPDFSMSAYLPEEGRKAAEAKGPELLKKIKLAVR